MDRPEFDAKLDSLKEYLRADREAMRADRVAAEAHAEARHTALISRIDMHTLEVRNAHIKHEHDTTLQIVAFERDSAAWRASSDVKYAELKGELSGIKTSLNMLTGVVGVTVAVAALLVGYIQYELTTNAPGHSATSQNGNPK